MSHNTKESENSPESSHLGEIKRMRKPGTPLFFARARDEASCELIDPLHFSAGGERVSVFSRAACKEIWT